MSEKEKQLKKEVAEIKKIYLELYERKVNDNFKLRQKNEELKKEIQKLKDFNDDQKTS
jgi:Fe-S-cluster formation regulator IscX/YfhJ